MVLALASAVSLCAYDHPLSDNDVRNAYFLGTDKQRATEFLSDYIQGADYTEAPGTVKPGPQIVETEVLTPYALAVDSSRQRTIGYSAQDAEEEYNKNPDRFVVRIQIVNALNSALSSTAILPPAGCSGAQRIASVNECFKGFKFSFAQEKDGPEGEEKQIDPHEIYGTPIYSIGQSSIFLGANVWFEFRASEIASKPLEITLKLPDGQKLATSFDLAVLR